jgi:hypothetical protein
MAGNATPSGFEEEQAPFNAMVVDDEMFDMTNLSERRTGLGGVVHCSTIQGQHGPRVKWYPGRPGRDAPCLVIALESPPRAVNQGLPALLARSAERDLVCWAELNRTLLLSYWFDGLGWTEEERATFLDAIRKLP